MRGIAYKTGTSYGHRDALAIGFDGRYRIGVWLGRADGASMPGELGADLAAPLLFDVFAALGPTNPLPPPPANALTVSHADLPYPLRKFRRKGALDITQTHPRITFPPDGAQVFVGSDPLVVKVANGVPPFTWLANGRPVQVSTYDRTSMIDASDPGHLAISVIDATGASERVEIRVAD